MALDKINRSWKTQVDKGLHGQSFGPLRGAKLKKIDSTFWEDTIDRQPVECAKGQHVEDEDDGHEERTLYGPKSRWKRYVSVKVEGYCAGPDVPTTATKGTNTKPL